MGKHYCQSCGQGTQFDFELPKFCSHCAESFDKTNKTTLPKIQANKVKRRRLEEIEEEEYDDEEEEVLANFKMPKKIELDFQVYNRRQPLNEATAGGPLGIPERAVPEVGEDWMREHQRKMNTRSNVNLGGEE